MATNKSWKDAGGETKELAEFHNIVAWNKMAEICQQLLAKGMKVYIEGSLNTRSWEGEDGATKYKTEIRVNDMILLDNKGKQGAGMDSVEGAKEEKPAKEELEEVAEEVAKEEEAPTEDQDPLEEDLPF
jgi:single-strand DNA-binding protein